MCTQQFSPHELVRLANRLDLRVQDYERLAMAVFGNLLAKQRAHKELWNQRAGGLISFYAYEDGRKKIDDQTVIDTCWRRLRQDLHEGRRDATTGVQCAFAYAKRAGLSRDPLWGGERKREVERILFRRGIDPNAPPGMRFVPQTKEEAADKPPQKPDELVTPDVFGSEINKLPIAEQLGIADFWLELPDRERFLVNAILDDKDQPERAQMLRSLAGDRIYTRTDNRDIPHAYGDWLREFPPELRDAVDPLPPRSKAILAARYAVTSRRDREAMHQEVLGMLIERGDVRAKDLLRLVMRQVCNSRDSIGARLRYEMQLEQGTMSFSAFVTLVGRHLPKLAAAERKLAARHAQDRRAQLNAELQIIAADPGLEHIGERYAEIWEVANRSSLESAGATARGFGKAAWGTVTGIVDLLTTDPRKTAAGIYHLAKNPQILINALDDAMVDQDELAGAFLFELASSAVGAGPASKASQAAKAARLANAAEKAASAGKLRAARRLADAAEAALEKARKTDGANAGAEAQQILHRTNQALDDAAAGRATKADTPKGYSPHDATPDGSGAPTPDKPMRDNLRHRYRHVPFGGFRLPDTQHVFIQAPSAELTRRIHVRFRQLQRFEAGRKLIKALDDALERTAQADVDALVKQAAERYGWTDEAILQSERTRLLRDNRRNRRVVVQWIGEKGRIQCKELLGDHAHRDDALQQAAQGSGSVISFDPDRWKHIMDDGSELRPPTPAIALGHELIHALRHATGRATRSRVAEEFETIGLDRAPEWTQGVTVTENQLRKGWADLQKQVVELRTDY